MNKRKTFCQQCHMKCPVVPVLKNGKIDQIENTKCPKGLYAHHIIYHPNRVTFPLKRIGQKGEGKWQKISWNETLEIMSEKFNDICQSSGPEAISTISGCYHKENAVCATFLFSHLLNTPNILDANHLCIIPDVIAQIITVGDLIHSDPLVDYKRSKCILIWGANPAETRPPQATTIFNAKTKGAQLIVIDPRPTATATHADLWLRLRPGTDAALALGMLYTIINEDLYDKEFVKKWCVGFEDLKERVQGYSTAKVADICWLPERQIIEAARMFATIKPACLHTRLGSGSQNINATYASQAITILMALIGCIDVPGGNLLGDRLGGFKKIGLIPFFLRLPPDIAGKRIGADKFPLTAGADAPFIGRAHTPSAVKAMLRGEIKAFFVPGSNFVINESNSREVWHALKHLDFLVVSDFFKTPTAELADLVLPAAHWLETDTPLDAWTDMGPNLFNYVMAAPKIVEPIDDCWDDRKMVLELAKAMGLETPWDNISEFNNWRLEDLGLSFEEFSNQPERMISFPVNYQKFEKTGFNTPSGKIELRSSILEATGYDPLPRHIEPPESPLMATELTKSYPFILTTFRHKVYEHTESRQIEALRKLLPDPLIEINTATAGDLDIEEGDEIWIETPKLKYRVKGRTKLEPELHPKVVAALFGWWYPEKEGPEHGCFESNINTIIDNGPPFEPINGNYQARGIPCRIGKVDKFV